MVGKKDMSRLEVDAGAIFDRNKSQNDPQVVQVRSARPSGRQKSRRSGRFVLFVPSVSSRLVVLVVPGGRDSIVARENDLPEAS